MLILQMLSNNSGEWIRLNAAGYVMSCEPFTDFASLAKCYAKHPFTLLFPGEHLRLTTVKLPKMRLSQRIQAIPYALEEQLIGDPENLHVAISSAHNPENGVVALLEKNRWEKQLALCKQENCLPACAIPDFLSIYWEQDAWSLVFKNKMALVRTGFDSGFTIDQKNLFLSLQLALTKYHDNKPKRLLCWLKEEGALCDVLSSLSIPLEIMDEQKQPCFDLRSVFEYPPINLLQGKYRPAFTVSKIQKKWRWCVIAAGVWMLSLFSSQFLQWLYFSHQSKQLENQIHAQYHVLFSSENSVIAPRERTHHLLKQYAKVNQNMQFLRVLSKSGKILMQYPAIALQSFQFDGQQLQLNVQVNQKSVLNAFIQQLQAHGLLVTQGAESNTANVIVINTGVVK